MTVPAAAHFAQRGDFVGMAVQRRILARLEQEAGAAEIGFLARFPASRAHADALRRVVETDIFQVGDDIAHGLRAAVIIVARIQVSSPAPASSAVMAAPSNRAQFKAFFNMVLLHSQDSTV